MIDKLIGVMLAYACVIMLAYLAVCMLMADDCPWDGADLGDDHG